MEIVAFQMMILSDLIEMGHDTVMMDIDVVFPNDPLQYVRNELNPLIDVWTQIDPRWDGDGPANTGFVVMRSNCKTKLFMLKIMEHILVVHAKIDQWTFNFFLHWKPFRQIQYSLLDRDRFIDGANLVLRQKKPEDFPHFERVVAVHASWTTNHLDKIIKFNQVGHWYFTEEQCPEHFDHELVPDLSDRYEGYQLEDTSAYLLNHNLITDKKGLFKKSNEAEE